VPASFTPAPIWDVEELRTARNYAERRFTQQRREEGPLAFEAMCEDLRPQVEAAFARSKQLRALTGDVFRDDPASWQVFRYMCGPPISQEDLWTLVEGPKFKSVPDAFADATAAAMSVVIDPFRFPWVNEARSPLEQELESAIVSTTALWSAQRLATNKRKEASARQEDAVGSVLAEASFNFDSSRARISVLDTLERGTYSKERIVADAKCDVPVRLLDGRLLALECKVSNGPKNGWKRLNRETGGKSEAWRAVFGTQVVTGVVIAGVFDVAALAAAQTRGVSIFWEHDLQPLVEFVAAAI
jgi:hypothetical protein